MKIRPEQIEAFARQADEDFIGRIEEHLMEEDAETIVRLHQHTCALEELSRETLRRMIRNGIDRARSYGFTWEATLFAFVWLMFEVAPNFDDHPLIRRILEGAVQPEDRRIDLLWEQISEESWEAAESNYDPTAWGVEYVEYHTNVSPDFPLPSLTSPDQNN
jgi:hypothetical protein